MATKKKTIVEETETNTENIVEEVIEQVEETPIEETPDVIREVVASTPLSVYKRDLSSALDSNNLEWLIEIINKINNDKTIQEYKNIDIVKFFNEVDSIRSESLLYFYRTFKYVENRENKILDACIFLSNHENNASMYKECLNLITSGNIDLSVENLEKLIWLTRKFNDTLNRVKFENLLKEKNK